MNLNDYDPHKNSPQDSNLVEPEMNEMAPDPSMGTILPEEPHPLAMSMQAGAAQAVPLDESAEPASPAGNTPAAALSLLDRADAELFCTRWNEIQGKFVDEPRTAVQQADVLMTELVEKLTRKLASEHSALQGKWNESNSLSTEDLRKALLQYRAFFDRLVV